MILAAGATGRLLPVIDELLARGHEVRVTARESDQMRNAGIGRRLRGPRAAHAHVPFRREVSPAAHGAGRRLRA